MSWYWQEVFLIPCRMYNDFVKYKKGFGKWMFNRLAANPPVFISTVNPEVRIKVATNLLRDYGYFNGKVTYETRSEEHTSELQSPS